MSSCRSIPRQIVAVALVGLLLVGTTSATATLLPLVTADLGTGVTPTDLVDNLLGLTSGAIVSNVTYSGADTAAGTFSGGTGVLGFEEGVMLSSGTIGAAIGPNTADNTSTAHALAGDSDLDTLADAETFDAAILEFDFECPGSSVVSFQYVFASEEYNEFVNDIFNDAFGWFLNGSNIALLPGSATPVSINTVNGGNPLGTDASNSSFYVNNDLDDGGGAILTEADGLTVVLGAEANLNPGVNHMKLAIADAGDSSFDSWVFLKAGSFQCAPLAIPVPLDIKPTSCPNPVNCKGNGVIPVAILGTAELDVSEIDVTTIELIGPAGSVSPLDKWSQEDVATPYLPVEGKEDCDDCTTAGPDGYLDLSLKFDAQDVVDTAVGEQVADGTCLVLTLRGQFTDGEDFVGEDVIRFQCRGNR